MKEYNLFASKISSDKIDPLSYNKDKLVSGIMENYHKNNNRNKWDNESVLHHYYDDWDNNDFKSVDFSELIPIYNNIVFNYFNNLQFINDIKVNWAVTNIAVNTKYMKEHDHVGKSSIDSQILFSCIHYVKFNPSLHSPTIFSNPLHIGYYSNFNNILIKNVSQKDENFSSYLPTFTIDSQEDDFIIFPSYLKHSVIDINKGFSDPRIVVALNIEIVDKNKIGE